MNRGAKDMAGEFKRLQDEMTGGESGGLDPEIIFGSAVRPAVIGSAGEVVGSTGSTMDLVRDRIREGAPDGYVVVAEQQTSGRGRSGDWVSMPGRGILVSVLLLAGLRSSDRMLAGLMAAVGATEAVRNSGVRARIKWPNDIVTAGGDTEIFRIKKLGGVLVEQFGRGDSAPAHVIGIGLNINQTLAELPAQAQIPPTSVRIELGRPVSRSRLCAALLGRLDQWYKKIKLGQPESLLAGWKNLCCLTGRRIKVRHLGKVFDVEALGLSAGGELIVRDATGGILYLSDRDTKIILQQSTNTVIL